MYTDWIAHIRWDMDGSTVIQSVDEHCRNTAEYAKKSLDGAGLGYAAYLAGLHHDDGKRTHAFRDYITAAFEGKQMPKGTVVHSFTGTRFLLETFHRPGADPFEQLTAELLACAIGSHHGLFDCVDDAGMSGFRHRLTRPDIGYEEAVGNLPDRQETEELFCKAVAEISQVVPKLLSLITRAEQNTETSFYFGLLARLLTSGVIAGDRRDTAEFMNAIPSAPEVPPDWEGRLRYMEEKLSRFPSDTAICRARQAISQKCRDFAEKPGGIYRLNVPTGAGKTLSSLRFALAHAARHKKSRIIFTSPLLSILEQNAAVLREYIGDPKMVLEHHSNVVREKCIPDTLDDGELLTESWSAPVIITTLVQLLNTLFSGKTTSIRRFQSLVDSVIVIDEVQTVPSKMLSLFNLAVNFLAEVCNATVVLCSATQPCLEQTSHGIREPIEDIVPFDENLWAPFRRTELVDAGARKLEDIPGFAREVLETTESLLIICNKKEEARRLTELLSDLHCFHLSAAMCPEHRRDTLIRIRERLGKEKVVCVSTQVIEAGVDISFGCVIRLTAGMDNAVQAAGRCNRNGESAEVRGVYLLNCADENLGRLQDIQWAKNATTALLDRFRRAPQRYAHSLSGDEAIRDYYQLLYREMPRGHQDFSLGKASLYQLLSDNPGYRHDEAFILQQAFRTAGQLFQVFDSDTTAVVVPYGRGRDVIEQLGSQRTQTDLAYAQSMLEQAKPYCVNLYRYQFEAMEKAQGIGCDQSGRIFWLEDGWYDPVTGLITDKQENSFLEV